MKRVVVHIDRLLLRGFRREGRHSLVEGLRGELSRQLADPDALRLLMSRGDVSRLEVGVRVDARAKTADIGVQAARGIAREKSHERR